VVCHLAPPTTSPHFTLHVLHVVCRSKKIEEIAHNPWAEVAWYLPDSREQFRLLGRLTVVDSQTGDAALQQVRGLPCCVFAGLVRGGQGGGGQDAVLQQVRLWPGL